MLYQNIAMYIANGGTLRKTEEQEHCWNLLNGCGFTLYEINYILLVNWFSLMKMHDVGRWQSDYYRNNIIRLLIPL